MYCIECGAKIPENSKFCPHCGNRQNEGEPSIKEKIADVIIEKEITRQVVEAHKSSLDYIFLKKAMGWYLAWVLIHLGILLVAAKYIICDSYSCDRFWPFNEDSEIKNYDIREFLVYTIFPLAILIIYSMVNNQETPSIDQQANAPTEQL